MGILDESKKRFLDYKNRVAEELAKRVQACKDSGGHDESQGALQHHIGRMSYGGLTMQGCAVSIEFSGRCTKCGVPYTRPPTRDEMQTPLYEQLRQELMTQEKLERLLDTPMTI